ncbi:MAG: hypothetical protein EA380_10830 [Phycisphaeraceae bacterium]|nr:MAG: hypothetical protein EA380_10830 [Phycisphaeraceae bacterium]
MRPPLIRVGVVLFGFTNQFVSSHAPPNRAWDVFFLPDHVVLQTRPCPQTDGDSVNKPATSLGTTQTKRQQAVRDIRKLLAESKHADAIKLLNALPPKLLNKDAELLFLLAAAHELLAHRQLAIAAAEKSIRITEHPDALLLLARCHRVLGETEKALRYCERAREKAPGNPNIEYIRAGTLEEAGRFSEAIEILQPIVEKHAVAGEALPIPLRLEWSKLLVQQKRYDEAVKLIDETVALEGLPPTGVNMLFHLKAKACDRAKDYDAAAEAAEQANEIGRVEFDPDLYTEQVSVLIDNWSRETMASFPLSTCDSEIPVFVAGMPRSGTSLIDQIIDAHPKAAGVGELNTIERFAVQLSQVWNPDLPPEKQFGRYNAHRWTRAANDYVREITKLAKPGTERIVNKALGNNKLVGLFARLFPKTRIIHAIRDPRDVAISCFMGGFNNNLHAWTTRIDWTAHAWNQSMRMMRHWKESLDIPILDVHYERLVADPENEMPRIIEFLGLEWDDACRDFYKSRRTVRTLSYDQVNRPLYTTSSGRHKNYAKLLEGVDFPHYDPFGDR